MLTFKPNTPKRSKASQALGKESSLSKSISLAESYHSSILSLIHLLIPLFLCHLIQMFPELVLVHGSLMSCWGLWQSATSFYPFTSCFGDCLAQFGSMECMWACLLCLCVCVLNLDHAVTRAPNPPCAGIYPPLSVLVCLPFLRLVHNLPTSSYFTLGEEHRTRVRRLPSSHLWALTLPQKTHPRSNTLSPHAQCLAPLLDLHMSPSSSLMHRHTVELSAKMGGP